MTGPPAAELSPIEEHDNTGRSTGLVWVTLGGPSDANARGPWRGLPRMSTVHLLWRRPLSPALAGTLAVLALLPRVSLTRTLWLAISTLVAAVLPIAVTVISGRLIGTIPDALRDGLASPAGQQLAR